MTDSSGSQSTIHVDQVRDTVSRLCIEANRYLPADLRAALAQARQVERSDTGREILGQLCVNADLARDTGLPICQDTGMAVVFLSIGQDVRLVGGDLRTAVNDGVADGYRRGHMRASVVGDPLLRNNTGDNTPAVLHMEMVTGTHVGITVVPKGFGSENMSAVRMLSPSDGEEGIRRFVLETVERAGANPCPPIVVGVGIGGTFEQVALLAKQALLRPIGQRSPLPHIATLEASFLEGINRLGIGPAGYGGSVTALGLAIETAPTHIAGLPVALNMSCHATRHATAEL